MEKNIKHYTSNYKKYFFLILQIIFLFLTLIIVLFIKKQAILSIDNIKKQEQVSIDNIKTIEKDYIQNTTRIFDWKYVEQQLHFNVFFNTKDREIADSILVNKIQKKMVILVIGQSNASNRTESLHTSVKGVYNFLGDTLYDAKDPLLGNDGGGGTIWTRLGDLLITKKKTDAVVFVTRARGGSAIKEWSEGIYSKLIEQAITNVHSAGLKFTHVFWQQGESDAYKHHNTSKILYKEHFMKIYKQIRGLGVDAPIYITVSTVCDSYPFIEIQNAQKELCDERLKIFQGPNTDLLGLSYRNKSDRCHFNDKGATRLAELWYDLL